MRSRSQVGFLQSGKYSKTCRKQVKIPTFDLCLTYGPDLQKAYFWPIEIFQVWGDFNRFADPQHKSIKFRGIPRKVVEQWQKVQEMDGIMTESPRNNDKDIDEILTKIRSPHTKSNSKNENQERAVWNVGQRLRGICVCGVCVCVRVPRVGREDGRETALCSKLLLWKRVMRGRPITHKKSWGIS